MTFEDWLARWPADLHERDLASVRILYATYMLVFGLPYWGWIAELPESWYSPPPGMMPVFSSVPPVWALEAATVLVALLLGAVLVGYRTRTTSIALAVVLLLGTGFSYSWGKINHTILLVILPLFLAPAGWGNALSLDARKARSRATTKWPVTLFALAVALALLNAAIPKALSGWLDWGSEATRGHLIRSIVIHGRDGLLAEQAAAMQLGGLWPLADVAAVVVEAALIVLILRRSWFRAGLVALCVFHVAVLLTLNIAFTANLVSYTVFFAWPWFATRRKWASVPGWTLLAGALVLAMGAATVRLTLGSSPAYAMADLANVPHDTVSVLLVVLLSVTLIALDLRERVRNRRSRAELGPASAGDDRAAESAGGRSSLDGDVGVITKEM